MWPWPLTLSPWTLLMYRLWRDQSNFSEIEQSAAKLWRHKSWKLLGRSRRAQYFAPIIALPPRTHNAPTYQISAKSDYPRLLYFRGAPKKNNVFQKWVGRTPPNLTGTFQRNWPLCGRIIDDSINFHGSVFSGRGVILKGLFFRVGERLISNFWRR